MHLGVRRNKIRDQNGPHGQKGCHMFGQHIPVVWGVDKKYVLQAFVVMRSILLHSTARYHFFILTADHIDIEVRGFTKILEKEYDNFKISVKRIDPACLEGARIYNDHLSVASYFRLLIPEFIHEYDKCIYLDCDLIVHTDLKGLYEIGLDNAYLAGVKDCHVIEDTPYEKEHQRIIGLPARDRYVNVGVLLLDLKKMRQDKMISSFMEQLKRENWYEDQDVLNVCCYPFIKTIPLKYDLFHFYLGAGIKHLYGLPYDRQEFDLDPDVPYILHMGGKYKPWEDYEVKGADEWWQIAGVFSASESYRSCWQKCRAKTIDDRLPALIDRAKERRRIVIWGYSKNGKRLCDILLENQLENIGAFADNNASFWGQSYRGIPVMGPDLIDQEADDVLWIISCQIAYKDVQEQLKEKGINETDIIRYEELFTEYMYLLSRNERAYDDLVAGIARREYIRKLPDKDDREHYIKNIMEDPLRYATEYAYLAERYAFSYWFETWHGRSVENEDISHHGMPGQRKNDRESDPERRGTDRTKMGNGIHDR